MKAISSRMMILAVMLVPASCGTVSDDPRRGGLAGWFVHGPTAYERRLDERRQRYGEIREEIYRQEQKRAQLAAAEASLEPAMNNLLEADDEIRALQEQVASRTGELRYQQDHLDLLRDLVDLRVNLLQAAMDSSMSVEDREKVRRDAEAGVLVLKGKMERLEVKDAAP